MPQGNILPEGFLSGTAENERLLSCREGLTLARDRGTVLEAMAERCGAGHELILRLPGVRAIIPRPEAALGIAEGQVRDIAILSRVGKPVAFRITDISGLDAADPYILCSRRLVQQGGITLDGEKVTDASAKIALTGEVVIKKGKKIFHKAVKA